MAEGHPAAGKRAGSRGEPFHVALTSLRRRLHEGVLPPGARIAAVDTADALQLSATPVREALSRLAGEGVLEDRRGQGYFVRVLSTADIADLYRISLAQLLISQDPHRVRRRGAPLPSPERAEAGSAGDAVRQVEQLFAAWAAEGGSRLLVDAFRVIQLQLGPVRRVEPMAFEDLPQEAERLGALDPAGPTPERLAALRLFHGRRIRLAGVLAAHLTPAASPRKI